MTEVFTFTLLSNYADSWRVWAKTSLRNVPNWQNIRAHTQDMGVLVKYLHREDGPAIESHRSKGKLSKYYKPEYWLHGEKYDEQTYWTKVKELKFNDKMETLINE